MYISLNWLKDFVEIPKSIDPNELGEKMTMHMVEIDDVILESKKYDQVVVGEIKEVRPHPNADRLQIAIVDVSQENDLSIVCGAPNIKAGQKVPTALVGAVLPGEMVIKAANVRGEDSEGMLCAEDELGLGDDHEGIMILDKKAKTGQAFGDYLKLQDVIYEVDNKSITNRPDLWCHQGMARDISVFLETKFKPYEPKINIKKETKGRDKALEVKILDQEKCLRYMAIEIEGIEIKSSPEWMQKRLVAVGVRPLNNIVDITNYVMMELGQPMHAFDSEFIAGGKGDKKIIVRRAEEGEEFTTLDQEKRKMTVEDLMIADSEKAIAVAGVMGGENSEIKDSTKSIIFESANFDFVSTRKTSARLALRTDASKRYEKSLDPNLCELALLRAVELVKEIVPEARVSSQLVDEGKFKLDQGPIEVPLKWLEKVIGEKIDKKKSFNILTRLGFSVLEKDDVFKVTVPTWRATKDVSIKEDIAEEVARMIGYNKIGEDMPATKMEAPHGNEEKKYEKVIRGVLSGRPALTEVYNYSFVGEEQLDKLGIDYSSHIRLLKPIVKHHSLCRQSLVPNLLENVKHNQARNEEIKVFEIGSIYSSLEGKLDKDDKQEERIPYQEKRIGIALASANEKEVYEELKGIVGLLLGHLNIDFLFDVADNDFNWAESSYATNIVVQGNNFGSINVINLRAKNKLKLKKKVAVAEISLAKLIELCEASGEKKVEEFAKYPPLTRDLAFVVNRKVSYNNIREEILAFHELIKSIELFDVFEDEKIGADNKSLAFHVVYQAEKTLTAKEVDEVQKKLLKHMEERFGAKIRDF